MCGGLVCLRLDVEGRLVARISSQVFFGADAGYGDNRAVGRHVAAPPPTEVATGKITQLTGEKVPPLLRADIIAGSENEVLNFLAEKAGINDRVGFELRKRQFNDRYAGKGERNAALLCVIVIMIRKIPYNHLITPFAFII